MHKGLIKEIKVAVFLVTEGNDCSCRPHWMREVDVVLKIDIWQFKEATEARVVNIAAGMEVRERFNLGDLQVLLPEF